MGALLFLGAIHAAVLGVWLLPRSAWEWLQTHVRARGGSFSSLLRSVPMALICGWISFAIILPISEAVFGKNPARPWDTVELIAFFAPSILWFITFMFAWPRVLIPPGARTEEAIGEAAWFGRHPLPGVLVILGLICLGVGCASLSHH